MDGITTSNVFYQNVGQTSTQKNSASNKTAANAYANSAKQETYSDVNGEAYSVNISDEALNAMSQESDDLAVEDASSQGTEKLTADQVQALKDEQEASMLNLMIQILTANNDKLQGWYDEGTGILNFGGIQIDTSRFALPSVATNPEDAEKAVSEGGDWSVGAVSDRIFGLAEALSGGNPEKLEEMRAAVEEGFKQAGMVWKEATGESNMPEITQKTYNEIMGRFDKAKGTVE